MKKRRACFLLAVLLCLCVLVGCGGQSGFIEAKLPETFEISRMELTLEDYAIINQPVEGGYEIYLYALYEFPGDDVITAEEIRYAYENNGLTFSNTIISEDENEPDPAADTRPGAQIGRDEDSMPTRESYFIASCSTLSYMKPAVYIGDYDETAGKRPVIIGGKVTGGQDAEDDDEILHVPAMDQATVFIDIENLQDRNLEENQQKSISFVFDATLDHIIEKDAAGNMTGGEGISEILRNNVEMLMQQELIDTINYV